MLDSFPKHHIASARKDDAASGAKADALAPLGLYAGWPKAWPLRLPGKPAGRSVRLRKGRKGLDVIVHARGAMPPKRPAAGARINDAVQERRSAPSLRTERRHHA